MSTIRYNAELERFIKKENGIYWLSGWCFSESGEAVTISVCDETGNELPVAVRWTARPDVQQYFSDISVPSRCGFELELSGLDMVMRKHRRLTVQASDGSCHAVICRRSVRDLRAAQKKCSIYSFIDEMTKLDKITRITGWAYGSEGPCQIKVLDEKGRDLPFELKRIRRKDIERLYRVEDMGDLGFSLKVENDRLKGGTVHLRYICGQDSRDEILDPVRGILSTSSVRGITYSWLSIEKWKQSAYALRRGGFRGLAGQLLHREEPQMIHNPEQEYEDWFASHRVTPEQIETQKTAQLELPFRPLISIAVPLYNTRPDFLRVMLQSVQQQSYDNWELCLADGSTTDETGKIVQAICGNDSRVKYRRLEENRGIAGNTNEALSMAGGEYVCLTDHDDILEPDALFEIASVISADPSIDVVYTDEDLTDESGTKYGSPRFKPDFNLDFLRSINYICHIFLVRREIMEDVGGFRKEFDGAQDWDMILRCCEKAGKIRHIPRVLYHWRAYEESTAGNPESKTYAIEAGKKALEAHFQRCGLEAELEYTDIFVLFRPALKLKKRDRISIIICTRDEAETLSKCVNSILNTSTYDNYEIILVENNSVKDETFALYEQLCAASEKVRVVRFEGEFNYSAVNNFGASFAEGGYYILLNNDTEVITPDWMERMLAHCQREDVAAVGAKLLYPDETVQHCGVVLGLGGFAGHILTGAMDSEAGYFGRLQALQDVSAVTAACMMVSREMWEKTGGLDEEYAVALNDIDFCLRLRELGRLIVLDPGVKLHHFESKSRGLEEAPEKKERFKKEIRRFRDQWASVLAAGDPYYSPNLTLRYNDCRIRKDGETLENLSVMTEILEEERLEKES